MGEGAFTGFFYHTSEKQAGHSEASESDDNATLKAYITWYNDLEFKEQVCWSFNILPSQLIALYWSVTYEDIRFTIKVKISERMADFTQQYESLGSIVSKIFSDETESPSKPKSKPIETWEEAQLAAAAVFS